MKRCRNCDRDRKNDTYGDLCEDCWVDRNPVTKYTVARPTPPERRQGVPAEKVPDAMIAEGGPRKALKPH